jgi:phosphoribosylanthranilate isomerase
MNQLQIKYCGNKSLEDLEVTSQSNADYLGFIFAESKRKVDPTQLNQWLTEVNIGSKQLVGVFVNESISTILSTIDRVPLSVIQCHGTETREYLIELKQKASIPVWKVIHHADMSLNEMKNLSGIVDGYVIDSKVKGMWGGSGQTFDWSFIPVYIDEAKKQNVPCFIAGGVNTENVGALLDFDVLGIDISSGIEEKGIKDKVIITKIEEQVTQYDSSTRP